jgi:hypothetical protein
MSSSPSWADDVLDERLLGPLPNRHLNTPSQSIYVPLAYLHTPGHLSTVLNPPSGDT